MRTVRKGLFLRLNLSDGGTGRIVLDGTILLIAVKVAALKGCVGARACAKAQEEAACFCSGSARRAYTAPA